MAGTTKTDSTNKRNINLRSNIRRLADSSKLILIPVILALFIAIDLQNADAQTSRYEILTSPDLWYNDVDGIRVGVNFKGQVPGTFEDGPHRLNAGFWLGTWFPDTPVSYYLLYTEPISAWSEYGSEASIEFVSSIRTGYHKHGIGFNKRWQQGFDERRYREIHSRTTFEKRFDDEYVAFTPLWGDESKVLTDLHFELQNDNRFGWYNINLEGNLQYLDDSFGTLQAEIIQRAPINESWGFRFRYFTGVATSDTQPEYLYSRSTAPAIQWMRNGVTRAKGTIPQPWMQSGNFNVAGGASLRGYSGFDVRSFKDDETGPLLYQSIAAVNIEFDYPNPIGNMFGKIPYASEFLAFRSYLFSDTGFGLGITDFEPENTYSNAGAGFALTLNIPDYHGKSRGFVLRYEIPFWLSEPGSEDAFKFRSLFGFGAVVTF